MKSLFVLIIVVVMSLSNSLAVFAEGDDTEKKLAEGKLITVLDLEEGSKIKKGMVIGIVDAPANIVWQVIGDNNNFREFMPNTEQSKVVDKIKIPIIEEKNPKNAKEVMKIIGEEVDPKIYHLTGRKYSIYYFSLLNLPWPAEDRWYIIMLDRDETHATHGIYRSSWNLVTGNLKDNYGSWHLEPYGEERTKVTYKLFSDPGGNIPKWLINWQAPRILKNIIKAVRKESEELLVKTK